MRANISREQHTCMPKYQETYVNIRAHTQDVEATASREDEYRVIYPASHFVTPQSEKRRVMKAIRQEMRVSVLIEHVCEAPMTCMATKRHETLGHILHVRCLCPHTCVHMSEHNVLV